MRSPKLGKVWASRTGTDRSHKGPPGQWRSGPSLTQPTMTQGFRRALGLILVGQRRRVVAGVKLACRYSSGLKRRPSNQYPRGPTLPRLRAD